MTALGSGRRTIKQLLVQGYTEIPEVFYGTIVALCGLTLAGLGTRNYYAQNLDNRKYKMTYVIMRPDDPMAALVHKD